MNREISEFKEIITEASKGVNISEECPIMMFNTYEMNYTKYILQGTSPVKSKRLYIPNIIVVDKRKLDETLHNFVQEGIKFYGNNVEDYSKTMKVLISNALLNSFLTEMDDIKKLFERYINFYKNDRLNDYYNFKSLGYSESLCGNIIAGIRKRKINKNTPLSFNTSIERMINNELYYFDFPIIEYGINGNDAYIFGIKTPSKRTIKNSYESTDEYYAELNSYQETIKQLLDKAINSKQCKSEEIIALSIFMNILKNRGIRKFVFPTILLNRYNSEELSNIKLLKELEQEYMSKEKNDILKLMKETKNKITFHKEMLDKKNEKLIQCFKYIESVFEDFKIYDYPYQRDTNLYIYSIGNKKKVDNHILKEICTLIDESEE